MGSGTGVALVKAYREPSEIYSYSFNNTLFFMGFLFVYPSSILMDFLRQNSFMARFFAQTDLCKECRSHRRLD